MSIRIICLEEHVADPALAEITSGVFRESAPYWFDQGSAFHDDPEHEPQDRPRLRSPQRAVELTQDTPDARVEAMDADGIDMQILSYAHATQRAPAPAASAANDRLAAMVRRAPTRLGGFCTLPWLDVPAAVAEVERCRALGSVGALIAGRPCDDGFLDDPRFEPVLARLAELDMPLYVHPGPPMRQVQRPYYDGFDPEVTARLSLFGYGWHNETGVQIVRLILAGVLDRHPKLRLISGHWGELVPFMLQRMDDTMPPAATGLRRTISQTYREQVYVTPSGMLYLPEFTFCHEVLGAERIMFAVDYPFLTMTGARRWLEALPISEHARGLIAHGNAEALLRMG